jgi:hypothetical protein
MLFIFDTQGFCQNYFTRRCIDKLVNYGCNIDDRMDREAKPKAMSHLKEFRKEGLICTAIARPLMHRCRLEVF